MKPKILIVEDEPTDANNFDQNLKSLGYNVVGIASTGEEALDKAAELRPDLVLLSIVIKGSMDGFETGEMLKNHMEVPVVYLTTKTDTIGENRAMLTYPYFYLIKPVSRTDLKKMVELAFEKHEIESNLKRNDERLIIEKELAFKLSELSQLDEILNTCLDAVITVSGMDSGGIYLVDEISGNLKLKAHTGLSDDFIASAAIYHADSNNARIVMKGKSIYTNYQEIKTYLTEAQQKENLRAFISTPIEYKGKIIANLNLASHTIYKITETNKKALNSILNQIGGAIIRAKVELELAETKKFTEKVIHSMSEGISILDINGVHIDVNQSLCQMTGYSREELIGTGMPHLYWPEEDYEKLRTEFESGMQRTLKETELVFKRKNGERFPVLINPSTLTDDDGNINIYYATIKDITERKKTTENLQKSERKYRSIIENAVEGIVLLDRKGNFTEINDSLLKITNYRREELIGKNFIKLLPLVNLDNKRALCLFDDIIQGIIPETDEWTITNKNGDKLTFLAHYSPIKINNQVEGISIILEDITARKESAKVIEENEEKYRTLFESNPNYTIIINLEGILTDVNQAAQDITGLSREELVGTHFSHLKIFPDEEVDIHRSNFSKILKKRGVAPQEARIIDNQGKFRWIQNNFTLVSKNGKADHILIIGNDITERKKAEYMTQKHLKKLSILNQVINMVNSVSHLDDLYREILNSTKDLLGYDGGCIYLLEENQQYSKLVYHENYPAEFINKYKRIKLDEIPTYSQLYTNKKPMYFDFTNSDIMKTGFRAVAIVPLFSKGEVIGSINVSSSSKHYFSELEKDIIESIGTETGTVITKMFSEEQIKESLNEKELLLKEIHHRVKNNLQIISSLLDLQVDYVKEDQTAVNVLRESRNRVLSMAMIHEMIYQSEDLSHINFSDYIRNLTSNLFNSYGVGPHISSIIKVDQVSLNIETSIPLGMITSEIVSNSLKYAFNDHKSGEIYIKLRDKGENYQLIISDNGVGLPQNIDINNEKTLGLRLIHSLVSQIDGTVELDRTEGTKFDIKFKELTYKKRY